MPDLSGMSPDECRDTLEEYGLYLKQKGVSSAQITGDTTATKQRSGGRYQGKPRCGCHGRIFRYDHGQRPIGGRFMKLQELLKDVAVKTALPHRLSRSRKCVTTPARYNRAICSSPSAATRPTAVTNISPKGARAGRGGSRVRGGAEGRPRRSLWRIPYRAG